MDVPAVCILDPDGDIVRRLRKEGRAKAFEAWPCYHTQLDTFEMAGQTAGIIGCAVGAPFAVLIAEELFVSGCRLLLSLTSAGQIVPAGPTPYFVIIDRACATKARVITMPRLRNTARPIRHLVAAADDALKAQGLRAIVGASWTTDAPFRETAEAIEAAKAQRDFGGRDGSRRALHVRAAPTKHASSAWRTSPIRWRRRVRISRRARRLEPPMRSPCWPRSFAQCRKIRSREGRAN